jgi:hypothetical protein
LAGQDADADAITTTDASVGAVDFCAPVPSTTQRDLMQQLQAMLRKQCVHATGVSCCDESSKD